MMMSPSTLESPHRSDDELLRFLDGECPPLEFEEVVAHVESCDRCLETVRGFHDLSAELRNGVARRLGSPATPQPRESGSSRPGAGRKDRGWLRAAVVILGLVGLGMTVAPVRALVLRIAGIGPVPALPSPDATNPAPPKPPPLEEPPTSTVSFIPAGDVFRIRFTSSQTAGRLVLRRTSGAAASGGITGDRADVSIRIAADGLRIDNQATTTAGYIVVVPPRIARVIVAIGADPTRTFRASELTGPGVTIPLWGDAILP